MKVLTDAQVMEIRERYARDRKRWNSTSLAQAYGVTPVQICNIINGKCFKHLPVYLSARRGCSLLSDGAITFIITHYREPIKDGTYGTWTIHRLANKFGVSSGTVRTILLQHGLLGIKRPEMPSPSE